MANFFPAASRIDVERTPSYLRRTSSRSTLREGGDDRDSPSDSRLSRPSHISWLQNSLPSTHAGPTMPKNPPGVRLNRSASLSALPAPAPSLRRQSSLVSNHSLQLDQLSGSNPKAAATQHTVTQLSPISEQSYVSTPRRELCQPDMEPSSPVSAGSTYSAFLRRPVRRSISATSTSSFGTNPTPTQPPTLPPLNIPTLDLRPIYPPVSHRAGAQLISTVFEDTASERSESYVTAPSSADAENTKTPTTPAAVAADDAHHDPSGTTTVHSSAALPFGGPDQFADSDRVMEGTTLAATATPPGGGSISNNTDVDPPRARPRPRKHEPTSSGSGSGGRRSSSETFIWRRWTQGLSFGGSGSSSRTSFTAARRAHAALIAHLPPAPLILFWTGFIAPWCWLIGGWLVAEARWRSNGKARPVLELWKPRVGRSGNAKARRLRKGKGKGKDKQVVGEVVPDPLSQDLERGAGEAERTKMEEPQEARSGPPPHLRSRKCAWTVFTRWNPFAWLCAVPGTSPDITAEGMTAPKEKMVTFVKSYDAEVWVYRCRLAAVVSALILLIALIVTLVVIGTSSSSTR